MKDIQDLNLPEDVRYAEDHEWVKPAGENARIGISDYAQDQLGDITYVELPEIGDSFSKGDQFGTLESAKAVGDLFLPISGEITAVNPALAEEPELVNQDPYGGGWIVEVKPADSSELDALMDRNSYLEMLKGIE